MVQYYELSDVDGSIRTYRTKAGFIRGIKSRMKLYSVVVRYLWQADTWVADVRTFDNIRTPGWQGIRTLGDTRYMFQNRGFRDWDCARMEG